MAQPNHAEPQGAAGAADNGVTAENTTDVLIIGAGLSGIGIAATLRRDRPQDSFLVLEARDTMGGTWDLFRYPGIRSDSDLYTFAYDFKPWTSDKAIAPASEILDYLQDTIDEYDIGPRIRTGQKVVRADFSNDTQRWTITAQAPDGTETAYRARFVFSASGYYDYGSGYTPHFEGTEDFTGQIIHPQQWPEDLDYAGKKVVVIGSGATAVTLVPAMAPTAGHVTMLQRTPTYILPIPQGDTFAKLALKLLGPKKGHLAARRKNAIRARALYVLCQRFPKLMRKVIRHEVAKQLPDDYPVDTHFDPPYNPWDQRLCLVPDGDLFKAISNGSASVVTDHIERFTTDGILLRSGETLEADIVITATGLNLLALGGVTATVDGEEIERTECVAFKGMLMSNMPNFAFAVGYTNITWTLKIELVAAHLVRLLDHMDSHGYGSVVPELPPGPFETRPLIDFEAGYVLRAIDDLPRQGPDAPWVMPQNYFKDIGFLRRAPIDDPALTFRPAASRTPTRNPV